MKKAGKYAPLESHLRDSGQEHLPMTFREIERVIDAPLPPSAFKHPAMWSNNPANWVMTKHWLAAGYRTEQVDMKNGRLVFRRAAPAAPPADAGGGSFARSFGALKGTVTIAPGVDLTAPIGNSASEPAPADGAGELARPKNTNNHQLVTEVLQVLTTVLAPYVAQALRAEFADEWWSRGVLGVLPEDQRRNLPAAGNDEALIAKLDAARCLRLMDVQWLFHRKLSRQHRTWIKELIRTRNKWAHVGREDMADEDARRAVDTTTRLIKQIDAQIDEAAERLRALAHAINC